MKKNLKYYSDEQKEVQSFIKILVGLIILLVGAYLFTIFVVDKKEDFKRTNNPGVVEYSSLYIGSILSKVDDEYYVLVFDSEDVNNAYIINKASAYKSSGKTPLYTSDLSSELNKQFRSDTSVFDKNEVSNLRFSMTTLVKVKNGVLVSFTEDMNEISNQLN